MRTAMLMQRSRPGPAALIGEIDELKVLLGTGTAQTVVVVDDAIDTGGTVQRIVGVVQAMDPRHSILTFALTSTLGLKVHDRQLHLFEDVVEFIEGDLGVLDEQATAEILAGLEPMLQSLSATAAVRLDVDARDLLTRAPHECIARALISALETIGKRAAALRLHSRCALWRLSRPASAAVARILSREFAGLPVPARKSFGALLAAELRAAVHPILRELIVHPRLILRARIETAYILAVPLAGALGHVEIIEMQSQGSLLYPHPHETGLRSVLDSAGRRPQAEN
jgi:hypothetical protein